MFFVLFRTGAFLASGDVPPLIVDGLRSELGWQWTHQNSGAGGPTYEIARAVEVAAVELAHLLGGTEALGQRLLFAAIWGFAAAAGAALATRFTASAVGATVLGLTAVFNPYTLVAQPNPLPVVALGIAAAVIVLSVDAARGGRPRWAHLALLAIPCSYVSLNPPLLALLAMVVVTQPLIAPLLAGPGPGGARLVLGLFARSAPLSAALSAWWVVPAVIAIRHADPSTVRAVTSVDAWSWTHARSSVANVLTLFGHWSWPRPEYYGRAVVLERLPWSPIRWVLPLVALASPVAAYRARRRAAVVVVGLIAVCVFVGKGLHRPWSGANRWLYANVPAFWLFREPAAKVSVVLVLLYVIGFAITFDALMGRLCATHARRQATQRLGVPVASALVWLVVVLPLIGVWPLWTGAVVRPASAVNGGDRSSLPSDWRRVAAEVNRSALHGKTLVLPIDDYYQVPTTWGFYGADNLVRRLVTRPVIQSNPQLYVGDSDVFDSLMRTVEKAVSVNDGQGAASLLRALGVSHVVVRKDIDFDSPIRSVHMERPATILAGLRDVAGLRKVLSTSVADVFELTDRPGAAVEVLGGIVTTGDLPAVGLGLLRSALPTGLTLASSTGIPGLVAGRALVLPASSATTTTDLGASGGWTATRQNGSAPLFRVRVVADALSVDELVTWTIGGKAVLAPRRHDATVPGLVGVDVDRRFVDRYSGGALVRLDAATTATPWVRSLPSSSPSLGPRSGVLDCNNHDTSSFETLGLAADEPRRIGGDVETELRALRHSACVRFPIRGLAPGASFHVHVEGRSMSGAPPRFCIWVDGPNACAPLDELSGNGAKQMSAIWRVPAGATAAALYLYADESADGSQTVTRYRSPVVEAVRSLTPLALRIAPSTPTGLRLPTGSQPIAAVLNATRPNVGGFGPLGDCNRADSRTPAAAGLTLETIEGGIRLRATRHAACASAHIDGLSSSMPYVVSFEHRTLRGERARFCVLRPSTGACVASGRLERSGRAWTKQQVRVDAPDGVRSTALALYVYADGGGSAAANGTVTEYRNVRVVSLIDEYLTLISDGTTARTPPLMSFSAISPARYRVHVTAASAPFVLALSDSWSNDWRVTGVPLGVTVDHLLIDGYRNGWAIDGRGDLDLLIEYTPARAGQLAIRVSVASALVATAIGLWARLRRPRRHVGAASGKPQR